MQLSPTMTLTMFLTAAKFASPAARPSRPAPQCQRTRTFIQATAPTKTVLRFNRQRRLRPPSPGLTKSNTTTVSRLRSTLSGSAPGTLAQSKQHGVEHARRRTRAFCKLLQLCAHANGAVAHEHANYPRIIYCNTTSLPGSPARLRRTNFDEGCRRLPISSSPGRVVFQEVVLVASLKTLNQPRCSARLCSPTSSLRLAAVRRC